MKITKLGHCCLLIEENGLIILTDPGSYSTKQSTIKNINVILISHEHVDHLHVDSLKEVLVNNPTAQVVTNTSVGMILDKEGIPYILVDHGQSIVKAGIEIAGFGKEHWKMYKTVKPVENTAYFIGKKLFYPGDSFYDPKQSIDVLALPVAGPWATLTEIINYGLKLNPKKVFPVHDGMLVSGKFGPAHRLPQQELTKAGIEFIIMNEGDQKEF